MRIALITLPDETESDGGVLLLGKTVTQHQLEFAVASGCDAAIAMGDAHSSMGFRLRHTAEHFGLKFRFIPLTHNLLGAVGIGDEVIVFEGNVLPANGAIMDALKQGPAIFTVAADPGVEMGYERIDALNAWAGVMLLPGRLVENLAQLPRDCDASGALLRIGLQAKIPLKAVATETLTDGSWQRLSYDSILTAESRLMDLRLGQSESGDVSGWLAKKLLGQFRKPLFLRPSAEKILLGTAVSLGLAGVIAALYGAISPAFIVLCMAFLLGRMSGIFTQLAHVKAEGGKSYTFLSRGMVFFLDGSLLLCCYLGIQNEFLQSVFPPLMLLALLHILPLAAPSFSSSSVITFCTRLFQDRAVLSAVFAASAWAGYLEPATMAASVLLIGAVKLRFRGQPG